MNANSIVYQTKFVSELRIYAAEDAKFIVDKMSDRSDPLQAIHAYKLIINPFWNRMMPAGVIKVEVSARTSTAQKKFNIFTLLIFGPNVTALKLRAK